MRCTTLITCGALVASALFLSTASFAQEASANAHGSQPTTPAASERAKSAAPGVQPGTQPATRPSPPPAHAANRGAPPQNRSTPDPTLPTGTLVVRVVGANRQPIAGAEIQMAALFQSIAQGNNEEITKATTNAAGEAKFDGLDTAIRFSYGVSVTRSGATYDVPAFRLTKVGHRVLVHTFPVSKDPKAAFVGLQGYISVQVKDDLMRVDAVYRVHNMSRTTWKPDPIFIKLPEEAQGLEAKISVGDAGYTAAEGGVHLVGTFPPGQKDVPFSFHVPNTNVESREIPMAVPPHVVDLNVLIERAPGLGLSVAPAFPPSEERTGKDGKHVLLTGRRMRPGEGQLESIVIELSGLPVIGPGRWVATGLALVIALLGLGAALLGRKKSEEELAQERDRARATLLDEMLLLERAHNEKEIGPRTYEQTKKEILAALARLEPEIEGRTPSPAATPATVR